MRDSGDPFAEELIREICIARDAIGDCDLPHPRLLTWGIEQIGHELAEPALLWSFRCNLF